MDKKNKIEDSIINELLKRNFINNADIETAEKILKELSHSQTNPPIWGYRVDILVKEKIISINTLTETLSNILNNHKGLSIEEQETLQNELNTLSNSLQLKQTNVHNVSSPEMQTASNIDIQTSSILENQVQVDYLKTFPVNNWDRYQFISFLGEGGMGTVYKARDPRLNRMVALKFIKADSPENVERFLIEAQHQARLEHENICKVYEVGKVQDKIFIAMQFISGKTLKEMYKELRLEQRVILIRDVCKAMHLAHQKGMIHRDIKASNIMVERKENGNYRSYLLDFGLAREIGSTGMTMTGAVMGTPSYMSPEQARGETQQLDRRSDVYSLGATLYEVLGNQPPFYNQSSLEILIDVIYKEPLSLKKLRPTIPEDLDTITMKCLEKEPQRRYPSAIALAEDLDRFLKGELILAKKPTFRRKLIQKAKKNKTIFTIVTITLMLLLVSGIYSIHLKLKSKKIASLSYKFAQQVNEIETIMNYAHMLPLHNLDREKKIVSQRMKKIRLAIEQGGSLGVGPGHYALGRGNFVLHNLEKAHSELLKAWQANYRTPDVSYFLGYVLTALYKTEIDKAKLFKDATLREERIKLLREKYMKPAIHYLKSSTKSNLASPSLVKAILAYYDKDYDTAIKETKNALEKVPWLFDAKIYEGNIYKANGIEKWYNGNEKDANIAFDTAEASYKEAINMAKSSESVYENYANLVLFKINVETSGKGKKPVSLIAQASDILHKSIILNPKNPAALNGLARLYLVQAHILLISKLNPTNSINDAIKVIKQSLKIRPNQWDGHNLLGNCYISIAKTKYTTNKNALLHFNLAKTEYEKAVQLNPNFSISWNNLGLLEYHKAKKLLRQGENPIESFQLSIKNFKKSISINSKYAYTYNNLALVYFNFGKYMLNKNQQKVLPLFIEAEKYFNKSRKLNPNYLSLDINFASLMTYKAIYEMGNGLDAEKSLNKGIALLQNLINKKSNLGYAYNNLGHIYYYKGEYEAQKGLDPRPTVKKAILNCKNAIHEIPNSIAPYNNLALAYYSMEYYELYHGYNPLENQKKAIETLKKAVSLRPEYAVLYSNIANFLNDKALYYYWIGKSPSSIIWEANKYLDKSIKINPDRAKVYSSKAYLNMLKARYLYSKNKKLDKKLLNEMISNVDKAIKVSSNNTMEFIIAKGRLCNFKASLLIAKGSLTESQKLLNSAKQSFQKAKEKLSEETTVYHQIRTEILENLINLIKGDFKNISDKSSADISKLIDNSKDNSDLTLLITEYYLQKCVQTLYQKHDITKLLSKSHKHLNNLIKINRNLPEIETFRILLNSMKQKLIGKKDWKIKLNESNIEPLYEPYKRLLIKL